VENITIAYGNNTVDTIAGNQTSPALPYELGVDMNVTLNCAWDWTNETYRNMTISVTATTSEGFVSPTETYTTPAEAAAQINQTEFDLADPTHFNVTVANLPYSLYSINVTEIDLDTNKINITQPLVAKGAQEVFNCTFNWSNFTGHQVNITAYATYANSSLVLTSVANVTYYEITNVTFSNFTIGNPYMNVTVLNSQFSTTSANITQISVQTENGTQPIQGNISIPMFSPQYAVGANVTQTITCPWYWAPYIGQDVTVTVQTVDGFQATLTLKVE